MSQDWRNCAFNVRTMTNKAILSHRCSILIIGIYAIAAVSYVSVVMEINRINNKSGKRENELFLKMELPFVYESSPAYEIVMFVQFIQLLCNALVIGMLDALIITLVSLSFAFYEHFIHIFYIFTYLIAYTINAMILTCFSNSSEIDTESPC